MNRRFFHLQEFFLCYFHEDWNLDATTTAEVIHEYLACEDEAKIAVVLAELDELLQTTVPEDELRSRMLREYSLSYDPKADGLTMRSWLQSLRDQMAPPPHDAARQ